jgi:hypothetical protein
VRRARQIFTVMLATLLLTSGVALAAVSVVRGNAINQVSVARGDEPQTTMSTSFVDIPRAATTVSVPMRQRGLILARFSAESLCTGDGVGFCSVRIVVVNANGGTVEMQPDTTADVQIPENPVSDFAFDSTDEENITAPRNSRESYSMDRSLVVGPGNYTVKAQWATSNQLIEFQLDDWSLTVEKARTS